MSSVLRVLRDSAFAFPLQWPGEPKVPRSLSFLGSGGADLDELPNLKQRQPKNQSLLLARLGESSEEVGALKRGRG